MEHQPQAILCVDEKGEFFSPGTMYYLVGASRYPTSCIGVHTRVTYPPTAPAGGGSETDAPKPDVSSDPPVAADNDPEGASS